MRRALNVAECLVQVAGLAVCGAQPYPFGLLVQATAGSGLVGVKQQGAQCRRRTSQMLGKRLNIGHGDIVTKWRKKSHCKVAFLYTHIQNNGGLPLEPDGMCMPASLDALAVSA